MSFGGQSGMSMMLRALGLDPDMMTKLGSEFGSLMQQLSVQLSAQEVRAQRMERDLAIIKEMVYALSTPEARKLADLRRDREDAEDGIRTIDCQPNGRLVGG